MFNSMNRSRGKTFSLLLLFTECCTTVVHKYAKYDRCHTNIIYAIYNTPSSRKKTIGVIFAGNVAGSMDWCAE